MTLSKIIKILFLMPPLLALGCMGPSKRARKKQNATHLWKQQEQMLNDKLEEEEGKVNKEIRESKSAHIMGIPMHMRKDKRTGLYGHMDLIRE